MKRFFIRFGLAVLALAALGWAGIAIFAHYNLLPASLSAMLAAKRDQNKKWDFGRDLAIPVIATAVQRNDVPLYIYGVGTVKALNSVNIRAEITGKITDIAFQEGRDIKKGDVIARIDSSVYQAQYDQAVAKKAQDQALLDATNVELLRLQRLVSNSSGTQQQVDNQQGLVNQYAAQVKADQAAIEVAAAQLAYTTIRAPIDGRTGIRNVDIGNIVSSGDTTGIVTLSQIKPITVLFSAPQQDFGRIASAAAKGSLVVDALDSDGQTILQSGTLTVVDNMVDSTTGTVKLKAEFANDTLTLWPGAFVNARLRVDVLKQALTIPSAAVQRGPAGNFSYVVDGKNHVAARAISLMTQDDQIAVVKSGLNDGEYVVTQGFSRLQEGSLVKVSTPEEANKALASPPLTDDARKQRGDNRRQNGQVQNNRAPNANPQQGSEQPAINAHPNGGLPAATPNAQVKTGG